MSKRPLNAIYRQKADMTPYDLEESVRGADRLVEVGGSVTLATFNMLKALLKHEADKEAERCLEKFHNSRLVTGEQRN